MADAVRRVASFAIMSDLHCRLSSDSNDSNDSFLEVGALRLPAGRSPQQALLNLIDELNLRADALLVPGDLTNKALREGLSQSWDIVLEVGRKLRTDSVLAVLGNHDIDSHKRYPNQDPFFNTRNLRPGFPFVDEHARQRFFSDGFCVLRVGGHAEVVAVNTVIDHHDEHLAKRGGFDVPRIEALRKYLRGLPICPIRVGMMHHHPILHTAPFLSDADVIPTGDELIKALRQFGCQLIVHGHRHVPRLTMHNGVAVFAAGSFSANLGIYATSVSNMFHLVTLEEVEGYVTGRIRTWVYRHGEGWAFAHPIHSGFPASTGFDSRVNPNMVLSAIVDLATSDPGRKTFDHISLSTIIPQMYYLPPDTFAELQGRLKSMGMRLVDPLENGAYELWRLVDR
jgi:predicted phosphodiesterase